MQAPFQDKVVLITGGTGNLGPAVAQAFAAQGAHIVLIDRSAEKQRERYPHWVNSEAHWLAAPVDVTDPAAAAQVVEQSVVRFGGVDVLVNTVGGYRAGKTVDEMDIATWDFMMTLNARSAFVMCRAVIPAMRSRGSGKIVNVAARAGLAGTAKHSAYAASKAAVIRLTESLAAEVKSEGINVNCVLPSTIDTPENRAAMPKADASKWVAPESMADVILFLASHAARDIHGVALPVYGLS
jgi:NAD(P)-dependent dehydrogenase (short-subunit alcohol dehydrogenase family)